MKIFVTGGAGYLGSVLVDGLLPSHDVAVLDSFRHGVPSLAHLVSNPRLEIVRGDVRDKAVLALLVGGAEVVIHLAALVGPVCEEYQELALDVNLSATELLVSMLRPDQTLIFPCTNSGYGRGGALPCSEDDPMRPISVYGRTKVQAEEVALRHPRAVSLRFATLYGPSPRMRLDLLVNDFVYRAVTLGRVEVYEPNFRRCVLHVSDAAWAILRVIWALDYSKISDGLFGRPWNVGAENVTKASLCNLVKEAVTEFTWSEIYGRDPDQRDYDVSSERFSDALGGWAPIRSLTRGIDELVQLYRMPYDSPAWRNS